MDIKKEAVNGKEVTLRLFHVVEEGDNGDSVDLDTRRLAVQALREEAAQEDAHTRKFFFYL